MASSSIDMQREIVALLGRIVGDQPLPSDLQRKALEILSTFTSASAAACDALADAPPFAAALQARLGSPAAAAVGNRRLIYVHGICPHDSGYSDDWWEALRQFETTAFGEGTLGQTRLEVLWSDLVNLAAADMQAAALATGVTADAVLSGAVQAAAAPRAVSAEVARQQVADEIREALRDRADQHVLAASMNSGTLASTPTAISDLGDLVSIPGFNCIDDFSVYLISNAKRQQIIDRFIQVVRPELLVGRELDIIAHSFGSVVAYEGLRQLDADAQIGAQVRNFFTVGAALSLGPVKLRLRPANKDGKKPKVVRRWVNLDAHGDLVGGPLKDRPYAIDLDFLNLDPVGCLSLFGFVTPKCAHGSYFDGDNTAVNREIFTRYIDRV